jgi:glycine/D-amino acid oxidase-like deaminating enzyme
MHNDYASPVNTPFSWWEKCFWDKVDVAVAGAGITGLQVADAIKRRNPDWRVIVLERDPLALGASSRNAGFACFGSLTEFLEDIDRGGEAAALELAEKRYRGLQRLREKMGDQAIGFQRSGSLEVFITREREAQAIDRLETVNRLFEGITGERETLQPEPTQGLGMQVTALGIRNTHEGVVESDLLLKSLRQRALEAGVELYGGMEIARVEAATDGMEIQAGRHAIRARQIVWCTNAWAGKFLPFDSHAPARGQVLVTRPVEGLKLNGAYFFNAGYTYFRTLKGNRLLLGGFRDVDPEGEHNFSPETGGAVWEALNAFLYDVILPGKSAEIDMAWGGTMSMGVHRAPRVERINANQVICAGMSGMGVALAAQVAEDAAQIVCEDR